MLILRVTLPDRRVFMAVLAAGSSQRFGEADKLTQPLRGKRLGEHICHNAPIERLAPDCAFVIACAADHPCRNDWRNAGFNLAVNEQADRGMGTSVALAATLAIKARCDALLIALADMPFVPQSHLTALIDACRTHDASLCSSDGNALMPPAIFGQAHLAALTKLDEDTGARSVLKHAEALTCPPEWLIDIDTPEALERYI